MKNLTNIFISLLFVLCPLLSSCGNQSERTPLYYDALGLCNDETDPIHNCAWLKRIIQDNKYNRLIIAEVIGTLSTEVDNSELMLNEMFFGYQIYYENMGCVLDVTDGRYTYIYDCMGNLISTTGHLGEDFYFPDTTGDSIKLYKYDITEYNIIYEH
jgi:hypothetical protein